MGKIIQSFDEGSNTRFILEIVGAFVFALIIAFMLSRCAPPSTIKFYQNGMPKEAINYTMTSPGATQVPYIADNWFTGTMKSIFDGLGPYLQAFAAFFGGKTVTPVIPTPTPYPAPK